MIFGLVALLFVTWPLALHPLDFYGQPYGETDNHFWMLWRGVQLIGGTETAWCNYPRGIPIPLMDAINLPLFLMGSLGDPVIGYNLLFLANATLAMGAGYWLARQFVRPRAAVVAMLAIGCSPFLLGVGTFGLTEAWPVGLLALHLVFLLRLVKNGQYTDLLAAGLCLAAFALSGWYHALFGLVVEAVFVPWLWWRHKRWRGLLAQGGLAAFVVLPSLIQLIAVRSFWAHRWLQPVNAPLGVRADWRSLPIYGTDLLNLLLPSLQRVDLPRTTYLGVVVLPLAVLGAWRRRRDAAPFTAAAALLLLLALGYWVQVAGHGVGWAGHVLPGPARLLVQLVPALGAVSHWHRAVGPATVLLGILAAMGVDSLATTRRQATGVALLVLLDSVFLSQTAYPRTHFELDLPPIYRMLDGPGALIELPFDNGRVPFSATPARIYNRWQPFHGRPVAENYEGVDALLEMSRFVAVADGLCGVPSTLPPDQRAPAAMADIGLLESEARVPEQVRQLAEMGFAYIVLHRDRASTPEPVEAFLETALGAPVADPGGAVAWRLGR